ncbi:phage tail tape measure protein [Salmonella enterica subsp. enterica serovar Lubbock]|uniref:Phage tail tape measure protein n=3 Tax=Salmonella enterica TaxID=28901 RepID=A0A5Q7DS60_SALMO|nr:phage tail tape measure protein [Salmonella enterica]EEL6814865.1 phage tail tape measure protein [Salmonella enterica subsp. enterica serovar Montevideo]EGM4909636.1 phage tail tape measure protein [Salmonella enterica subsp. enterica serovar Infantis]EJZ4157186.1 phage tail tape measure protein [Salmonella enterica subsp. enterica serovar Braenderup]AYJ54907.1 phage tail tape measure protein [Salmonella enterica subsp. enterica serovar Mbandaka]AYJ64191.1 phage tail tape measure protein [
MATLRELIIKISANSQSFQSEISRASRMGNDYYRVMQTGGRQAAAASRETQRALAEVTNQINTAKSSALGMAGAFAGAFATGHLISLADEWSSVNARLKQASQSSDDFTESQRALMDISQRTGTAFSDNASLFARSAASMREYGYSSQQVLDVTEAISTGLKLSGASTAEASSVITQFSQALAQGVLRGEEFNSVNENGDRVIRALAAGMGVARKDMKAMADQGLLTADKVVPALISQLGTMRGEFEAMPQTVSAATTEIENAFMAWVGGANEATGATATLVSVMNGVADNIDTVAAAAGVLASIGGARYLGGKLSDLGSETANLIDARKNEIALAAARAESATQSQRKAAADALAAERAYQLAQSELALAKNTNAEALATQNAIAKRQAMIAANAALVQSNRAVATSQEALNKMTSAMNLVKAGASGLLSLVGGIPGILMLGAGAWYAMYQKQEQARESAIQYASTLDEVVEKSKQMSPAQINGAIADAGDSIDALKRKLNDLRDQQDSASASIKQYTDLAKQFGVENDTNNGYVINAIKYQREYDKISRDIAETTSRLNQTISNQNKLQGEAINKTVEMVGAVGSLTEMYDRLNKVTKQFTPVSPPKYAGPVLPALDSKQQQAIEKAQRQLELSGLQGFDKARKQAEFDASDLNLPAGWREKYVSMEVESARQLQAIRDSSRNKGGKSEAEKTVDTYDKLIKQQKEQIALAGQNTELAKLKYQVSQGELATLTESQKQTLLQNAALIDQQKIREQLRNYEANLADSNASSRAANEAQLIGYGQGSRFRERLQEQFNIRKEFEEKNTDLLRQRQTGEIDEAFYQEALALNKRYLDERLRDQQGFYAASDAQRSDWADGMREGFANWADTASDYASQSADLVNNAMTGLVGNISDALAGNKVDWEDWASSVLQSMQKIILNAMLVDSLRSTSNSGFFSSIGGMFGAGAGAVSGSTPSGAYNSAASGLQLNAKGGAYASASLSVYSNSIVSSPTYFAFAKGAGLMGEAGPEAIMPLTRSADGSLGVRVVGSQSPAAGNGITQHITQHFTISGNGDAALKQAMQEAARQGANDGAKQARQDLLQDFSNRGQARRLLGV